MTKIEFSFRSASGADVPNLAVLVGVAYRHYVGLIGQDSIPISPTIMLRSMCLGGVASVGTQGETMTGEPMFFE